jgi:putative iron-regulated protein
MTFERLGAWLGALAVGAVLAGGLAQAKPVSETAVVKTYADIGQAAYGDSLATAKTLQAAVHELLSQPTTQNLERARKAWIAARVPYQQTEAFRFGNKIVDDWEGKVNSWPLDEGLIDYVAGSYGTESAENRLYVANVIANRKLRVGGKDIDASRITKALLVEVLQEAEGIEANVSIGYHAIEFLLWGQDLNGTGPGRGNRPATDFDPNACTGGNCDRRADYLKVVTDLLVEDLAWMAVQWGPGGAARTALTKGGAQAGLIAIFTGMGSLSYGELAGERMKLGLLLHDPEEEHDCFSDNTHASHYNDALGIQNVYLGRYKRVDGSVVSGPSLSDLVKEKAPETDARLRAALAETMKRMAAIVARAEAGEAYDQQIGDGNTEGNAAVQAAIEGLIAQTKEIERAIAALKLKPIAFVGSDSLDNPNKVGKKK